MADRMFCPGLATAAATPERARPVADLDLAHDLEPVYRLGDIDRRAVEGDRCAEWPAPDLVFSLFFF
jgi:hypothetical protein